jgi:hypothetical protein
MRNVLLLALVPLLPLLPLACADSEPAPADALTPDGSVIPPPPGPDGSNTIQDDAGDVEGGGGPFWERVPIPVTNTSLFGIWGSSTTDIWAVGANGTALHWDGQGWKASPTGRTESLNAVWGTSSTNVWIASSTHLTLHGGGWNADGGSWTNTSPLTNEINPSIATLYDISGTGPNDVWAVGDHMIMYDNRLGAITIAAWHWSGDKWSLVPVVNDFDRPGGDVNSALRSVWPASTGDVWLGGSFGRSYRNPEWSPSVPINRNGAVGMAALAPWREYDSASRADIERTWGTFNNDVWGVGRNGVVRHWDGSSDFLWTTVNAGVTADLHSVWGRSANDVWVIGDDSTIAHWDGTSWKREPTEPGLRLYGIWGSGEDVWIVGESAILRRKLATGGVK